MSSEDRHSLWEATCRDRLDAPALDEDVTTDLAVIGGGFTGCSAALEAAQSGASVVLVDARTIGYGGSGRNVGLVNAGLWLPPRVVLDELGAETGTRLLSTLSEGPEVVFGLIEREGIDCEATLNGTMHLAHGPSGLRDLQRRAAQATLAGRNYELLDAAETARRTGSDRFAGALLDPAAGTIQPLAYCRGLARAAQRAGARILEGTPASAIARKRGAWVIEANGHRIRAQTLLLATNAYHNGIAAPTRPAFVPVSFSQFATAPLPPDRRASILPGGEGCWDTALVMSSYRVDRAGRLILGGIGNVDGPGGPIHRGWARRKLAQTYPDLADVPFEHAWSGTIAMTGDHIPKVVGFGPGALAVYGYSGRGMCPGTIFGTAAAKALLSGDESALPLPIIPAHAERFTGLRQSYYEAGAVLTHALRPLPLR